MPPRPQPPDATHHRLFYALSELNHAYGPRVHLLSNPYAMSLLAKLCSPRTTQPVLSELVLRLYADLLEHVVNAEFPKTRIVAKTRMAAAHPVEGIYRGEIVDPATRVVCVNIARAGTLPSMACYETLLYLLNPSSVRQDHVFMNRRTDRRGRVIGVDLSGSKIGGSVTGTIVLIPDPMGATGSSLIETVRHLTRRERPAKIIGLHLIVTPEYCQAIRDSKLPITSYAIRLDRGLSPPDVLETVPGTHWELERGLNEKHYIVPGAGGVGELLNNAES